jgi:hypothetical protein
MKNIKRKLGLAVSFVQRLRHYNNEFVISNTTNFLFLTLKTNFGSALK